MTAYIDIGIDLAASRLAAVVLNSKGAFCVETRTMPKDPAERAYAAERWAHRIVSRYTRYPDRYEVYVYVENPAFGRGGVKGTLPVAMIQGAIFAGAKRAGAGVVVGVNNQSWKKSVVGKGNVDKTQVAEHIRKHWPALYQAANGSQDVCDAGCIVLHGRDQIRAIRSRVAKARGDS